MRRAHQVPKSLRRMASLTLVLATVLALANLPADNLPLPWLLAFTLPGAVLGSWSRLARAPWQRALLAVILQATACYAALETVGPMTRPAALACTILPPLAFATTRNHDGDPSLALFLGFCVMLVGVILGGIDMPLLMGYGAAAFLSLHTATLLHAHRVSKSRPEASPIRATDAMATSMMMLSCMVAVFAIERTLSCLPSPSSSSQPADEDVLQGGGDREVGLDDTFILDGGSGLLSQLTGEQLVRATAPSGRPIPPGTYLRCGFFTVASMERWGIGKLRITGQTHDDGHVIRRANPSVATQSLSMERFGGAAKFVFLPPNATQIRGLSDLEVDPIREWIRPRSPNNDIYVVTYQDLPDGKGSRRFDPNSRSMDLTQLPTDIDIGQFQELLEEWGVSRDPWQAMEAISDGLASRCRYSRSEPTGEYRHKIENFLFSDGDRRGYCMHFASAAALMLRIRGIPCRIAVGLYGGAASATSAGGRIYGSQHAHAWIEIPLEGRGFYKYDPTPPDSRGVAFSPNAASSQPSDPNSRAGESLLEPTIRTIREVISTPWTWAIAIAGIIVLAMLPRRAPNRPRQGQVHVAPQARRALMKLLKALAGVGHRRTPGQTLELFADDLAAKDRLEPEVGAAIVAYQEVRFGGRQFDQARARCMAHGIQAAIAMQADEDEG